MVDILFKSTWFQKSHKKSQIYTKGQSTRFKCGWDLLMANINSIILQKYYNYIKNYIKFEKNVEILYNYK